MRERGIRIAVVWTALAALAAPPSWNQEQVRIQVPGNVVFQVLDLGQKVAAPPSRLSFDQALLSSGNRLRISVRAEGADLAAPEAPVRISFSARDVRGGTGFSGALRETDYTPVFESAPLALSGGLEIAWTLEPLGRFERAGARAVTLRWKIESVPGSAASRFGAPPPRHPSKPAGGEDRSGAAWGRAAAPTPRETHAGERIPPPP